MVQWPSWECCDVVEETFLPWSPLVVFCALLSLLVLSSWPVHSFFLITLIWSLLFFLTGLCWFIQHNLAYFTLSLWTSNWDSSEKQTNLNSTLQMNSKSLDSFFMKLNSFFFLKMAVIPKFAWTVCIKCKKFCTSFAYCLILKSL